MVKLFNFDFIEISLIALALVLLQNYKLFRSKGVMFFPLFIVRAGGSNPEGPCTNPFHIMEDKSNLT